MLSQYAIANLSKKFKMISIIADTLKKVYLRKLLCHDSRLEKFRSLGYAYLFF